MTVYRFVERERTSYPVTTMCRVLGVSPSGYWAWASRPPSARAIADAGLAATIREIHKQSRGRTACRGSTPSSATRAHAIPDRYDGK